MMLSRRDMVKLLSLGAVAAASGLILPAPVLAASARQPGLNENISTYNSGGGRDYTAMGVWADATDNDLVTGTTTEVLEGDGSGHNDTVQLIGAITNAQYHRIIRPAPGQAHAGKPGSGFSFSSTANADVIRVDESFAKIEDLLITYACNSTSDFVGVRIAGALNQSRMVGCIVYDGSNAGTGRAWGFDADSGYVILCAAMNNEDIGFLQGNVEDTQYLYNCVAWGNGENGFWADQGTMICKNCASSNNTGNDFNLTPGADFGGSQYNVSGDATAPGANSRLSQTISFVDAANGDAHLQPGDMGARGFGVDLSGDTTFPLDDDIDRELWTNDPFGWSMGIDAIAARRRIAAPLRY